MSLAQKRILITRPENQGESLSAEINKYGGIAIHYPVLEIVPLSLSDTELRQQAKQLILDLDLYHHVIFISTNAVAFGVDWIDDYWPQLPVGIQWHAIGGATAKSMIDRGLDSVIPTVAMNSEALLQLLDLQRMAEKKVLIVRGVGGREYLAEQLKQYGARVDYLECYQRRIPDKPSGELAKIIKEHNIEAICINSGESLENLCELASSDAIKQLTLIVPGERVANLAKEKGFTQLEIAENASDAAVLASLKQWASHNVS